MNNDNPSFSITLIKLAYLTAITAGLYLALAHRVYDDPFITYRYADNIRTGVGFVYNPGERILSTTTPLFAMLLALAGNIWPDLPRLANLIGAFSAALGGLLLWELGQTWKAPLVAWFGLLLYPTFPLLLSTLGSETPLFLTLVLAAFWLYARQRIGPAAFVLALAILTRSDGVLVALMIGVHYLWANRANLRQPAFWRSQPWGWVLTSVGLLLLWHAFAWRYFGAPLPVTLAAKQAQGRMAISHHFAPGLLTVASWYAGRWQHWAELVLAILGMGLALTPQHRRWLLVLGWTGLYFLAYALLGVTRYFWYYAPLVPGFVVAAGLGITLLDGRPLPGRVRGSFSGNRIRRGVVFLLITALFLAQAVNLGKMSQQNDPRYAIYRAAGEWLSENTAPEARVGALEVGIIGYFARRPMVDFAGLIQPEVAAQMQAETTYDDTATWAALTYRPKYLVLIDGALPQLEMKFAAEFCQPVKRFVGAEYDYRDLQIYACQY